MKARVVNIAAWEKWFDFQTFGEPELEGMLVATANFILDVREGKPCPWLVLLGSSGAGKTHLARRVWRWWVKCGQFYVEPTTGANLVHRGQFCLFGDFIQEGREGDFSRAIELMEDRLVVLDDIAAGADARGWITDKLYHIIERRLDETGLQATLITANLSIEKLAEIYDQRIASRLVRRGTDKVIEIEVTDYALRKP
jgi:DNA replication protein DnaC